MESLKQPEQIKVGLGVLALRDGRLLLGHRVENAPDTGGIYEPGSWCLPGGKLEYGETILQGAARELREETGLTCARLRVFGAADDIQPHKHYVTIHVLAEDCQGQPRVMEPDKQDEWRWFAPDALPEPLYSPSARFLRAFFDKEA